MSIKQFVRLFAVLALLIPGCGNRIDRAPTCADLTLFQSQISETFTAQEFMRWISETQGVAASEVKSINARQIPSTDYVWTIGNYKYSAVFEDNKFKEIRIGRVNGRGIPASVIVECFGKPEIYRAIHDIEEHASGGVLTFEMVFSSGVMASGYQFYRRLSDVPFSIDESFAIDGFVITSPGTAVEILQQAYINQAQATFDWIHPWPENWEDIKIDTTPEMERIILQTH